MPQSPVGGVEPSWRAPSWVAREGAWGAPHALSPPWPAQAQAPAEASAAQRPAPGPAGASRPGCRGSGSPCSGFHQERGRTQDRRVRADALAGAGVHVGPPTGPCQEGTCWRAREQKAGSPGGCRAGLGQRSRKQGRAKPGGGLGRGQWLPQVGAGTSPGSGRCGRGGTTLRTARRSKRAFLQEERRHRAFCGLGVSSGCILQGPTPLSKQGPTSILGSQVGSGGPGGSGRAAGEGPRWPQRGRPPSPFPARTLQNHWAWV